MISHDRTMSAYDRFAKGYVVDCEGCWMWQGYLNKAGYGRITGPDGRITPVHRFSWQISNGQAPDPELTIDHLCRKPPCVNPDHLELVSRGENTRRASEFHGVHQYSTHCPQGHEYTPENAVFRANGNRRCRECHRIRSLQRYYDRKAAS